MRRMNGVLFLVLICAITAAARHKGFGNDNFEKPRASRHPGYSG